jgi:ABC-2 type transport system permease protein
MIRLNTYYTVWKMIAVNAFQEAFINRWSNMLFIIGKSLRFGMSLLFLFMIRENTQGFGNYTTDQMVVFFLTYQLIDISAQVFYRGSYLFGNMVRTGEFDFFLAKPINPLFRALTWKPDINDVFFLIPTIIISILTLSQLDISYTPQSIFIYLCLLVNSFLIVTALHILVLTVGVMTTEVDGVIWMYRDVMTLGQIPISVYQEPLRTILFFILPIGMMITIPAEVLFNSQTSYSLLITTTVGISTFLASLKLWNWGLRQYSSASS